MRNGLVGCALPDDTVTGAAAVRCLEDHELPTDDSKAAQ